MSSYQWPPGRGEQDGDNPGARADYVRRARVDFDPEGARVASRAALAPPAVPPGHAGGPRAPANGRKDLWQPLGPLTVVSGQAIGAPRVAGRINMLAAHKDGERVYAASANGGVWYSKNGGASWLSLGGFAATTVAEVNRPAQRHACGSILVEFKSGEADDIVFVGTGETTHWPHYHDAQPGLSLGGIGILVRDPAKAADADDPWIREAKNLLGEGICRIAMQPGGSGVVAATTAGLFQRPGAPTPNCDWQRVTAPPFDTLAAKCSDVLWTKGDGTAAHPERLWVWVEEGPSAGLWCRRTGVAQFEQIIILAVPPGEFRRAALPRIDGSVVADQFYVLNDGGADVPPLLFRVTFPDAAKPVATAVTGTPNMMGKQGFYDIAIAIHPANKDRIVLGGSSIAASSPDGASLGGDAAIVVGEVTGGATPALGSQKVIGVGAHADVHDLVFSNAGNRLWLACDGGVFRSDHPDQQVGFYAVNDGLSVVESNYIACHPTCEGYVVTGLQDNGVISRRSNGVWQQDVGGDGGGVAFDPVRPSRYLRQYVQANWSSSEPGFLFSVSADESAKQSYFYSTPAVIGHRRGVAAGQPPNIAQVILGTSRVWYSDNFGAPWIGSVAADPRWVTLPSGTAPPAGDLLQDDFGQKIRVCRWQSPDVAWVLGESRLKRYSRVPGSDAAKGPGTWNPPVVVEPSGMVTDSCGNKKPSPVPTMHDAAVWTDIAVNLDPPPGAGQPPAQHGTLGALYVGTIGNPDKAEVDTLWWFDGTDKWHPTGLRKDPKGVPAPVTAIVCHPEFPAEVWVGTTIGVWRGVRTDHGADPPTWAWTGKVNGLPEAAVEDLAIFKDGNLMLLRAGIAARGVWELRLDVADVQDLTYVRAHDDDLRYRDAVQKQRNGTKERSWHGSPDVRPRRAPVQRDAPKTLPWTSSTGTIDAELLRRFQSALRARIGAVAEDPRIRATGTWDSYFNEVLRNVGAPLITVPPAPPNTTVSIDKTFWDLSMKLPGAAAFATAEPWGAGLPTEADLFDFSAKLGEGELKEASCTLPAGKLKVDIVVHRRGLDPIDGANVRVTLLYWIDPNKKATADASNSATWFSGNVAWAPAVNQVLNSADGKTALPVDGGWAFVLGKNKTDARRLTLAGQTLDAMHSGVATFDLDLTSLKAKPSTVVLLVAVIRAGTSAADDIALPADKPLSAIVTTSPSVAIRSLAIVKP